MHEIMFVASSLRLPIVMSVVNRALAAPINICNDLSDIMTERDTGWVQLFAISNGQEAFDLTLQAFKIAEDPRVLLPVAVNLDGFILSHVIEPIELLDQQEVDQFRVPSSRCCASIRTSPFPWAPLPVRTSLSRSKNRSKKPRSAPRRW